MKLTVIGEHCAGGTCPTAYAIDGVDTEVVIQGYTVDEAAPDGESMVRVPRALLETALGQGPVT